MLLRDAIKAETTQNSFSLLLASSSAPRKELLSRLQIPFITCNPDIDESQLTNEKPIDLVSRLAVEKAKAGANKLKGHLTIGADQVACIDATNEILGKPGNYENAVKQLKKLSGKKVTYMAGICLFNPITNNIQKTVVNTHVKYRNLSEDEIDAYIKLDKPYHCAGSMYSESFGISLVEELSSSDPTALIGLPLITLISFLKNEISQTFK